MNCPRCQHENRSGAKFCEECATPLRICSNCGGPLSATAKFCSACAQPVAGVIPEARFPSPESYTPKHLAEKILTSKSALEGERKQVTVLFADLKGSMELLADRDPEEARKILDPVLELMIEAVHRYEGTVNQVMGDGIMALFGAPLAHEDHALRACYAALQMQEAVKRYPESLRGAEALPIHIRVGLNSGEVVVRAIGSDLRMDYTAVGQTTHLASRMEEMADPGSILATGESVRLVEGYVQVTSLGRRPVRGLAATIEVYAVTGPGTARWPLEAAAARGLTGFVGREAELAQLRRAVQSAADGHGQVIGVVGEPGIGKSRLFFEATRPERMSGWLVLKTGAASYGKTTAYRPVIDLLRAYFKIHDRGDQQDVRESIATRLAALDKGLVPKLPALFSLLDVSVDDPEWQTLDPRQRRQQTMDAVIRLVLRESQVQPLCLVCEDLHWIDSETQALLDSLIESVPTARILLLTNFRPEYRHDWSSKSYYAQLRVDPLPSRDAQELLRELLGGDDAHAPLRQFLIERTKGNPFFLEESVRTLAENSVLVGERGRYLLTTPVQTIRIPATVQAVLTARIDRLAPEDKRLLQSASVIGETVPISLLQAVADVPEAELHDALARLRAAEFLYDVILSPESYYVFRHGLTCQVAYNSLLRERRRTLHGRIVDAIERLYPEDRRSEHVEQLAHHALQGELWDRAARYLREAGTKAFDHSANREAVSWFEQALNVLERLPETPDTLTETVDLHLGLRNSLTPLGEHERTLGHLRQAQALADRLGDRRRLGRALSFEVNCLLLLGEHQQAIESAHRARAIADELNDLPLKTVTDVYAGRAHLYLGDFPRAIEIFSNVVAALTGRLAHDHYGVPVLPSVFARSHLVECLAEVGRFEESARYADEAVALAKTTNHPDTLLWAYHGAGLHYLGRGEIAAATEALEHAFAICRAHDMPGYRPRLGSELGLAWAHGGRAVEAVPIMQQAVEEAAARHQTASHSQVLLLLAEVYLLADRLPEAVEVATTALDRFRRQGARGNEARGLWLLGEIGLRGHPNDMGQVEIYYTDARRLADKLGMRPLVAHCHLGLGKLYRRTGKGGQAQEHLTTATTMYREMGMTYWLEKAEAELRQFA